MTNRATSPPSPALVETPSQAPVALPRENIAGHVGRVDWLTQHLRPSDRVLELGCGTGYMITLPLLTEGYDITGIDLDEPSDLAVLREAGA